METKMIQVKYYFKEHPKTSLSVFLKTEEQVKELSKKNTLITSMSDSKNYNDFDELYEDFMESGSDEWLLPECGVKEELDRETLALLRSF